mmetsp:Transcript_10112/g.27667  ORF Transcript_10112/g.27667 Transcript_10112/m.27667 type:complete len:141 (+) Transcript_10112:650-1072(+)
MLPRPECFLKRRNRAKQTPAAKRYSAGKPFDACLSLKCHDINACLSLQCHDMFFANLDLLFVSSSQQHSCPLTQQITCTYVLNNDTSMHAPSAMSSRVYRQCRLCEWQRDNEAHFRNADMLFNQAARLLTAGLKMTTKNG